MIHARLAYATDGFVSSGELSFHDGFKATILEFGRTNAGGVEFEFIIKYLRRNLPRCDVKHSVIIELGNNYFMAGNCKIIGVRKLKRKGRYNMANLMLLFDNELHMRHELSA